MLVTYRFSVKKAIPLFFMVIALLLCSPWSLSSLERSQEAAFGIVMLAATLWISELIPLFLVSFVILAASLVFLTPHLNPLDYQRFFQPFFSPTILLFLGGFVLSKLLQEYSLDRLFAGRVMSLCQGSISRLILIVMGVGAFMSMWMSNTASAAVMMSLVRPLYLKLSHDRSAGKSLVLAVPVGCNLGGLATPIGSPPNAIALAFLEKGGLTISFGEWMLWLLPLVVAFIFFAWRFLLICYPVSAGTRLPDLEDHTVVWTRSHTIVISVFIVTIFLWLAGSMIGVTAAEASILPILCAFGLKLLKKDDFITLPWDVLFLIAGGMCLGVVVDLSGLGSNLMRLTPSNWDLMVQFSVLLMLTGVLTSIVSNTATASLMLPIAIGMGEATGNQLTYALSIAVMCATAMILPISTPPNAIAYGSGLLGKRDFACIGGAVAVISYCLIQCLIRWT